MRLLYLSNLRLPTEKAYGIQIAKMCEAFTSQIKVELVYPYRKNPDINADFFDYYSVKKMFKVRELPAPDFYLFGILDVLIISLKSLISAIILSSYALSRDSDIIYSRDEIILYFLSFFKKNLVFEAHRFSPKRRLFYNRFKRNGVKLVAISGAIKNDFVKIGYNPDDILVAHDGVDLELFDINLSKDEARKKLNLPIDKKVVMYTGHLFEWKGADTLLQAAKSVLNVGSVLDVRDENNSSDKPIGDPTTLTSQQAIQQLSQCLFVFVGGMEYDIKKFKQKAKDLDNILVLGRRPYKEIPVFLKAADVLVLPNSANDQISSYTSPLKLFEYMASGRPIVASGLPSIKEVLNDQNSILIKPDDSDSLAGGITKVLRDDTLSAKIVQTARQDVTNYAWHKRAEKIFNFINH